MADNDLQTLQSIKNAIRDLRADRDSILATLQEYRRIFGIVGWDDIYMPMSTGKLVGGGVSDPTWAVFLGNTKLYTFAVGNEIELPIQEFVHGYKEGTDFEFHVHIVTNGVDGTDRYVRYEIEYTVANPDSAYPAVTTANTGDYLIPANTTDNTHLRIDIGNEDGSTLKIGAGVVAYFSRIALDGGGAAPSSDPFVSMVGIHLEKNSIGSRREYIK